MTWQKNCRQKFIVLELNKTSMINNKQIARQNGFQ